MKTYFILLLALAAFCSLAAADITGDWHGMLDVGGQKLRIVFHIRVAEAGLSATMDSPDQNAFDLPVSEVSFTDHRLELALDIASITYTAELGEGMLAGTFKQGGFEAPLDMRREALEPPVYIRPQESKEPYSYIIEEVVFTNPEAGIKLAGTLTLPEGAGPFPAVVMISGSGTQNRDAELMGHKPFWVIADHLTNNGIAVLRYDDRGVGGSEGDAASSTTFDFVGDALGAVSYLKSRPEILHIGLVGHSEGGIIAPMAASESEDVDFIVLMAGIGIRGDKLLLAQEELIYRASGMDEAEIIEMLEVNAGAFELVINAPDLETLKKDFSHYLREKMAAGTIKTPEGTSDEAIFQQQMDTMSNPWMYEFIRLDPSIWLQKVTCPVLALNGTKDLQVPAAINLAAISQALDKAGNTDYTIVEFPGLNHLFQECETGLPDEYARIEQTIAPVVLDQITSWIKATTVRK